MARCLAMSRTAADRELSPREPRLKEGQAHRREVGRLLATNRGLIPLFVVIFYSRSARGRRRVVRAAALRQNAVVLQSLTERKEWKFFGVLPKAAPGLTAAWWTVLALRGILPAAFAIAMGVLVVAVERGDRLPGPLALVGAIFVLLQVLSLIHQAVSSNLGDRTAACLYYRLNDDCW